MNLKKGLSYVAFGFFFTLVNLNLTLNGTTINVTPDFIGWILLFLAFVPLGPYVSDKPILRWLPLVVGVFSAAVWVLSIAKPELDIGFVPTILTALSAVYMFLLFGALQRIARDYASPREGTLGVLRILNPALEVAFVVMGLLAYYARSYALAGLSAVLGVAALVAAIVTMVVLFRLRSEISRKLESE